MKFCQRGCLLLIGIWIILIWQTQASYGQSNGLIISQVGLSQAQGTTYLTMILNQADQPKITPVADRQAPQLLIDFPKAKVSNVPVTQAGDQQLVKKVRTTALPGGNGVRIILDLVPGRPYSYWRTSRAGAKGGYRYLVGIKPDSPVSETYASRSTAPNCDSGNLRGSHTGANLYLRKRIHFPHGGRTQFLRRKQQIQQQFRIPEPDFR